MKSLIDDMRGIQMPSRLSKIIINSVYGSIFPTTFITYDEKLEVDRELSKRIIELDKQYGKDKDRSSN